MAYIVPLVGFWCVKCAVVKQFHKVFATSCGSIRVVASNNLIKGTCHSVTKDNESSQPSRTDALTILQWSSSECWRQARGYAACALLPLCTNESAKTLLNDSDIIPLYQYPRLCSMTFRSLITSCTILSSLQLLFKRTINTLMPIHITKRTILVHLDLAARPPGFRLPIIKVKHTWLLRRHLRRLLRTRCSERRRPCCT